jgi:hypothetical protein
VTESLAIAVLSRGHSYGVTESLGIAVLEEMRLPGKGYRSGRVACPRRFRCVASKLEQRGQATLPDLLFFHGVPPV